MKAGASSLVDLELNGKTIPVLFHELSFARLAFAQAIGQLLLQFLLPGGESRDHVDGCLGILFTVRAAHGLAVDGDDFHRRLGQRRYPVDKAPLERRRVERGENLAQPVMRWRAVGKG